MHNLFFQSSLYPLIWHEAGGCFSPLCVCCFLAKAYTGEEEREMDAAEADPVQFFLVAPRIF